MIIDGKAIAARKLEALRLRVEALRSAPKLLIVTDDPGSIFVQQKIKRGQEVGVDVRVAGEIDLDADGMIVQLPHPRADELIAKIPPEKDVDGMTGKSRFLPATVRGILTMLGEVKNEGHKINNETFVVVGQGRLVGKPLADFLESKVNKVFKVHKVIRCDINTANLRAQTLKGDILVVATGQAGLITADMVKSGATVIDCGSPKAEVDFENVSKVAGSITPVPGGVGPMTIISLLENVIDATA